jgi:hypothetical protein
MISFVMCGFYSRLSGFFETVPRGCAAYRNRASPTNELNPPVSPEEVVYQVTFLVTGMVSYIVGQLFGVNEEIT